MVRSSSDPSVHASIRLLGSMSHLTYVHLSLPFVYPLVFLCLCVCLPKLMPSYLLILVCLLNRLCIPQFRCAWSLYALNVIRMFVCHLSNQPASFSPMGLRNLKAWMPLQVYVSFDVYMIAIVSRCPYVCLWSRQSFVNSSWCLLDYCAFFVLFAPTWRFGLESLLM